MSDSEQTVLEKAPELRSSSPELPPELPPEEGWRGWLCVVGSCICIFCTFGFLNAIGVFQATYQQTTLAAYSPSEVSWIFAVQLCLMWAPGPLFGRLIDTYGPGPVLYPCAVLCVFALCMTSLADQYYQIFLAQGLAFGIGSGGIFTTALVCVGQWFVRRRGLGVGLAACGGSIGGVVFPPFLNRVMQEVGMAGAFRYTALLIGVLLVAACFMVNSRLPRKEWDWDAQWFDFTLFSQREFATYAIGAFLMMWGLFGAFDFVSSMAESQGFSPDLALYLISIMNAASAPGRVIPPHFADRIGHLNVITFFTSVLAVSIFTLWLPFNCHPSHAGIIIFCLVYGFSSGAIVSLLLPCVAKAGNLETLGVRFGTFQVFLSLSCLTGLPIMGAILDRQGSTDYSGLQIFSGSSCLLGAGFLATSTYLISKMKGKWRV